MDSLVQSRVQLAISSGKAATVGSRSPAAAIPRLFPLLLGRPALITSHPWRRARAVTPGSRRSGESARREGKLAVETANCGRPLGERFSRRRTRSVDEAAAGGRTRHKHRYQRAERGKGAARDARARARERKSEGDKGRTTEEAREKERRSGQDDVDHAEDTACLKWARPANGGYGLCFRSGPPYPLPPPVSTPDSVVRVVCVRRSEEEGGRENARE